jgi:tetratricopeptide (TPR) repeat protein
MNIIDRYLALANQGRFAEGLPLIEEIVRRNPNMATSQFNYGICLAELNRHAEAARAFLRAYSLNPEDGGVLYRASLALADAGDAAGLLKVFRQECARDPVMIYRFLEEERFSRFWSLAAFASLRMSIFEEEGFYFVKRQSIPLFRKGGCGLVLTGSRSKVRCSLFPLTVQTPFLTPS